MPRTAPVRRESGPLLTVPDVMAELRVGRTVVYDLIKSGALRSLLVKGQRRIRRSALEDYLDAQERSS